MEATDQTPETVPSFFDRPGVKVETIKLEKDIPLGIESVSNPEVGIGGAYGSWGESYDNPSLARLLEEMLNAPLGEEMILNLAELGFTRRHHIPELSEKDHLELEVEVGSRFLREAAAASGWDPSEVQAVLIGSSGPVADDYTERIAKRAGIPEDALKVSVHKACDGSTGGLHLALNPSLPVNSRLPINLGEELFGKKILVGGIEGLSRFMKRSHDKNALQLFGNGAGVIGLIPGRTMKLLAGITREVFDEEGVLKVRMCYPHSRQKAEGNSLIEVSQAGTNHYRVAGMMHEPEGDEVVDMAGPMGMVKLFVRSGVDVVRDLYKSYQEALAKLGKPDRSFAVAIVHHANLKINKLKEKHLQRDGILLDMPWLLSEFGNVSAASNMIAFLRKLASFKPGDYILIDGFGAGTYYDSLAIELGG
jgi:3-oxoacyl-[acyl-carrier-protein] synthase III